MSGGDGGISFRQSRTDGVRDALLLEQLESELPRGRLQTSDQQLELQFWRRGDSLDLLIFGTECLDECVTFRIDHERSEQLRAIGE